MSGEHESSIGDCRAQVRRQRKIFVEAFREEQGHDDLAWLRVLRQCDYRFCAGVYINQLNSLSRAFKLGGEIARLQLVLSQFFDDQNINRQ